MQVASCCPRRRPDSRVPHSTAPRPGRHRVRYSAPKPPRGQQERPPFAGAPCWRLRLQGGRWRPRTSRCQSGGSTCALLCPPRPPREWQRPPSCAACPQGARRVRPRGRSPTSPTRTPWTRSLAGCPLPPQSAQRGWPVRSWPGPQTRECARQLRHTPCHCARPGACRCREARRRGGAQWRGAWADSPHYRRGRPGKRAGARASCARRAESPPRAPSSTARVLSTTGARA
mmetsp:Transcript_14007/g.42390  ORF Transcript_14007/g.42390 Transcript_14007/m.42390 type:complete len:230 (-) Transcript_14007:757-1446(-)